MAKIMFAANGKRDIHGLEQEFDSAFERLLKDKWEFDSNRIAIIEYVKNHPSQMVA